MCLKHQSWIWLASSTNNENSKAGLFHISTNFVDSKQKILCGIIYVGLKKDQGGKSVDLIISMGCLLESIKALVAELQKELTSLIKADAEGSFRCQAELHDRIEAENSSAESLEWWIQVMTELRKISSTASHNLEKLRRDDWLNLHLTLRVLQDQIVSKLQAQKFELENIDHAYLSQMLGTHCLWCVINALILADQQTQKHAEKAIKHHEPGIAVTIKKYNETHNKMLDMKLNGQVSNQAVVPPELELKGLFDLNVDADIWLHFSNNSTELPD